MVVLKKPQNLKTSILKTAVLINCIIQKPQYSKTRILKVRTFEKFELQRLLPCLIPPRFYQLSERRFGKFGDYIFQKVKIIFKNDF